MELDERTKERINNYFNGVSSEQLLDLAVKYNIREAIEWGQTKGQLSPIDSVMPSVYGIFKHGMDKAYGYYWELKVAEDICAEMKGEDYYVDELCVDQY